MTPKQLQQRLLDAVETLNNASIAYAEAGLDHAFDVLESDTADGRPVPLVAIGLPELLVELPADLDFIELPPDSEPWMTS
jgi:hypothetical protein